MLKKYIENLKIILKTIIKSIVLLNNESRFEIKIEPHEALSNFGRIKYSDYHHYRTYTTIGQSFNL